VSATGRSEVRDPDDFYETPAPVTNAILPHLTTLPSASSPQRRVLEPASGRGAIVERLWAHGVPRESVTAIELDPGRASGFITRHNAPVTCQDFVAWASARGALPPPESPQISLSLEPREVTVTFDCVITNPSFRLAMVYVEASLAMVAPRRGEVAMLLRMNWLASDERAAFHRQHPADIYVLPRRPSFCASIRCKSKCGWFVLQHLDDPRPKTCPRCASNVTVSTSDSTEYAWFVWGPGRGNRWFLLDVTEGA